jgi:hypothetical protein
VGLPKDGHVKPPKGLRFPFGDASLFYSRHKIASFYKKIKRRKENAEGICDWGSYFCNGILSVNFVWAQATTKSTPQLKFNAGIHCWETGLNPPIDPYG